jgi:hypothetical protein
MPDEGDMFDEFHHTARFSLDSGGGSGRQLSVGA